MTQPESFVGYDPTSGDATSFVGPDAVNLFRAVVLASALRLAGQGISVARVNKTQLLKFATGYTGKAYKRRDYATAAADVSAWVAAMKAGLPYVPNQQPHSFAAEINYQRTADKIDGFDRDDLGESPDY